jgi:AcrR family transcriptional regulator
MPRKPDPKLETRVLDAAQRLWIRGGDKALSLRAIARAARTNTPAIYRRFRNRKEILRGLVRRAQQDLYETLKSCNSLEEAGQRTFEFALARQREYEIVTAGLLSRINEPQPNLEFTKKRSAEWLGGSPEDYTRLVLALWAVVHGTSLLFITKSVPKGTEAELPTVLSAALGILVRNRSELLAKT